MAPDVPSLWKTRCISTPQSNGDLLASSRMLRRALSQIVVLALLSEAGCRELQSTF